MKELEKLARVVVISIELYSGFSIILVSFLQSISYADGMLLFLKKRIRLPHLLLEAMSHLQILLSI